MASPGAPSTSMRRCSSPGPRGSSPAENDAPTSPTIESPQPLAVKLGADVVELDAETIARIEALQEDVNVGRIDGRLLQRVIDAGLEQAEHGDRISGEVQREPGGRDPDEPTGDTPADEVPPTTPGKPTSR